MENTLLKYKTIRNIRKYLENISGPTAICGCRRTAPTVAVARAAAAAVAAAAAAAS